MQFELVDVFTSKHYRGNSLSVFPPRVDSAPRRWLRSRVSCGSSSPFFSTRPRRNTIGTHAFSTWSKSSISPGTRCSAPLPSCTICTAGDDVDGRWTLELASGALTVETERRGPDAFHAVLPDMVAEFLGEQSGISRAQVAAWFSLQGDDLDTRLPLEVVSTGLRYLIVPVRDGVLARARISHRELDVALAELGAEYAYLLDAEAGEGRHWNNDGAVEDAATGSAAGCVAAYLHRHGRLGDGQDAELHQGRFIDRPSRISISARSADGGIRVRVGGEVVLVGSGRLGVLPA